MKKNLLLAIVLFTISLAKAQTADQAKAFINKSHIAIFKIQKEIISHSSSGLDGSFKKAIRFQAIAVKLYKNNNFKEAAEYSYKSRIQSIELLENLNKSAVTFFSINDEEKTFLPSDYTKLSNASGILSDNEDYKIDQLDILNNQKLYELELNIN